MPLMVPARAWVQIYGKKHGSPLRKTTTHTGMDARTHARAHAPGAFNLTAPLLLHPAMYAKRRRMQKRAHPGGFRVDQLTRAGQEWDVTPRLPARAGAWSWAC